MFCYSALASSPAPTASHRTQFVSLFSPFLTPILPLLMWQAKSPPPPRTKLCSPILHSPRQHSPCLCSPHLRSPPPTPASCVPPVSVPDFPCVPPVSVPDFPCVPLVPISTAFPLSAFPVSPAFPLSAFPVSPAFPLSAFPVSPAFPLSAFPVSPAFPLIPRFPCSPEPNRDLRSFFPTRPSPMSPSSTLIILPPGPPPLAFRPRPISSPRSIPPVAPPTVPPIAPAPALLPNASPFANSIFLLSMELTSMLCHLLSRDSGLRGSGDLDGDRRCIGDWLSESCRLAESCLRLAGCEKTAVWDRLNGSDGMGM
ncbi:unnamed protein product [Closterium sp. NIES-64]|nr:unnamed protein product [Closterium sp. NIES-64]